MNLIDYLTKIDIDNNGIPISKEFNIRHFNWSDLQSWEIIVLVQDFFTTFGGFLLGILFLCFLLAKLRNRFVFDYEMKPGTIITRYDEGKDWYIIVNPQTTLQFWEAIFVLFFGRLYMKESWGSKHEVKKARKVAFVVFLLAVVIIILAFLQILTITELPGRYP